MAQNPQQHAKDYGLSRNAAADVEAEEGPPSGAHHGETRTRIPEHAGSEGHGPKTRRRIKDMINRQGGTH
jgi:hypothetical protein